MLIFSKLPDSYSPYDHTNVATEHSATFLITDNYIANLTKLDGEIIPVKYTISNVPPVSAANSDKQQTN